MDASADYDSPATVLYTDMGEFSMDSSSSNINSELSTFDSTGDEVMDVVKEAQSIDVSPSSAYVKGKSPRWSSTELISMLQQFDGAHDAHHSHKQKEIISSIILPGRSYTSIYQKIKRMAIELRRNIIPLQELQWIDSYTSRKLLRKIFPPSHTASSKVKSSKVESSKVASSKVSSSEVKSTKAVSSKVASSKTASPKVQRKRPRYYIEQQLDDEAILPTKKVSPIMTLDHLPASNDGSSRTLSSTTTQTVTTTKTVTATQTPVQTSAHNSAIAPSRFPIPIILKSSSSSIPRPPASWSNLSSPSDPSSPMSSITISYPTILPPVPTFDSSHQALARSYSTLRHQQTQELQRTDRRLMAIMKAKSAMSKIYTAVSVIDKVGLGSINPEARSELSASINSLVQQGQELVSTVEQALQELP